QQEEQVRWTNDRRRSLCRTADLPGGAGVCELERVRPNDCRQARAFFVIRWQVKRERARHTISTLVRNELFLDPAQLRCRIGVLREGASLGSAASHKVVRRFSWRFAPRDELRAIIAQQRDRSFVTICITAKDPF